MPGADDEMPGRSLPWAGAPPREGMSWSWELDFDALLTALTEPAPWNRPVLLPQTSAPQPQASALAEPAPTGSTPALAEQALAEQALAEQALAEQALAEPAPIGPAATPAPAELVRGGATSSSIPPMAGDSPEVDPVEAEFAELLEAIDEGRSRTIPLAMAAGRVAESLPTGPDLAGWLATSPAAELEDGALAGMAASYRRLASWAQAGELAIVAQLASRSAAADTQIGIDEQGRPARLPEEACAQVSLALTMSQAAASWWSDLAVTLTWRLHATGAALRRGQIDLARARLIADATAALDEDTARSVEAKVLPAAGDKTTGQLRATLRLAVIAADPEGAERRREEAERRARVNLYPDEDGTASLAGYSLSSVRAAAAMARITALARAMKASGAGGGIDLLRAQVFLGLLLGTLPYIPPATDGPPDEPPDDPPGGQPDGPTDGPAGGPPDDRSDGPAGGPAGGPPDDQPDEPAGGPPAGQPARPQPGCPPADGPPASSCQRVRSGQRGRRGPKARSAQPVEPQPGEPGPPEAERPPDPPQSWADPDPPQSWADPDPPEPWTDPDPPESCSSDPDPPPDARLQLIGGQPEEDGAALGIDSRPRSAWPEVPPVVPPGPVAMENLRPAGGGLLDLVVPWSTLTGDSGEPGQLSRIGPITAEQARYLADVAACDTAVQWRVIVTDQSGRAMTVSRVLREVSDRVGPDGGRGGQASLVKRVTVTISPERVNSPVGTGLPVILQRTLRAAAKAAEKARVQAVGDAEAGGCAHGQASPGYQPPPRLREFVAARDVTCRFPTCRQPVWRCDLDHSVPFDKGGKTCSCNLGGLCRFHHQVKQLLGWQLIQPVPGTFAWVTPSGRTYYIEPDCHAA